MDASAASPVEGQTESLTELDQLEGVIDNQDVGMMPPDVEQGGSKLLRKTQNGSMLQEKGLPIEFAPRISRLLTIIAIKHDKVDTN